LLPRCGPKTHLGSAFDDFRLPFWTLLNDFGDFWELFGAILAAPKRYKNIPFVSAFMLRSPNMLGDTMQFVVTCAFRKILQTLFSDSMLQSPLILAR